MLQSVILLWKCAFHAGISVSVLVCLTRPLPVYPIVFPIVSRLPVGRKHSVFHFSHGRCARSFWCHQSGNLRVGQVRRRGRCQYFGLQYLVQPLSVNPTFTFIFSNFADAFFQSDNWGIHNAISWRGKPTEEVLVTPSLRYCSNKYKLAREGEKDRDNFFKFRMMSSSVEIHTYSTFNLYGGHSSSGSKRKDSQSFKSTHHLLFCLWDLLVSKSVTKGDSHRGLEWHRLLLLKSTEAMGKVAGE